LATDNISGICKSHDRDGGNIFRRLAAQIVAEREARRLGDAMGLAVDWAAVAKLDDEMLVNAIAQVAPFDVGAKQALLEQETLEGRADLLVQLMQFQRIAVTGGVEIEPTLQ